MPRWRGDDRRYQTLYRLIAMPYTAQERADALRYALALMRNRLTVEAPLNAAAIQRHIDALIELVATAPPMDDE